MSKETGLTDHALRSSKDSKGFLKYGLRGAASRLAQNRARIIFNCVSALLAGGFSYFIAGWLPFYPVGWLWPVVLATILVWIIKPDIGVVFSFASLLLPIAYNSLTLALLLILLLLFISIIEIGALSTYGFFLLAAATLIVTQPHLSILLLIIPLSAGFSGARHGMVLGVLTGFWVLILALLSGQSHLGLLITGAQAGPLLSLKPNPVSSMFNLDWLSGKVGSGWLDVNLLANLFKPFIERPVFFLQIGLWGLSAGIVGLFIARPLVKKIPSRYTAIMGGSLILWASTLVLQKVFVPGTTDLGATTIAVVTPAVIVALSASLWGLAASMAFAPSYRQYWSQSRPHKVFVSYSSKDKPLVDTLCTQIEAAGLSCWMAPRDIGPGEDWPTAITKAISTSKVMVLIFSVNSNTSEEVSRELYLALNNKVLIFPFKIDNVEPEPGKAVYLDQAPYLEAMNPPTREQISKLVKRVKTLTSEIERNELTKLKGNLKE